jgi:hypothetical protein
LYLKLHLHWRCAVGRNAALALTSYAVRFVVVTPKEPG